MTQESINQKRRCETENVELIPQYSTENRSFWTNNLIGTFDGFSFILILIPSAFVVFSYFSAGNFLAVSIASFSAAFTVLAVRETKRNREANHAPTLFFATRNGRELGVKNVGNGPAHELTVDVEDEDGEPIEGNLPENAVVEVGSFVSLELEVAVDDLQQDAEYVHVEMSYRDCLGDEHTDIVRESNFTNRKST